MGDNKSIEKNNLLINIVIIWPEMLDFQIKNNFLQLHLPELYQFHFNLLYRAMGAMQLQNSYSSLSDLSLLPTA